MHDVFTCKPSGAYVSPATSRASRGEDLRALSASSPCTQSSWRLTAQCWRDVAIEGRSGTHPAHALAPDSSAKLSIDSGRSAPVSIRLLANLDDSASRMDSPIASPVNRRAFNDRHARTCLAVPACSKCDGDRHGWTQIRSRTRSSSTGRAHIVGRSSVREQTSNCEREKLQSVTSPGHRERVFLTVCHGTELPRMFRPCRRRELMWRRAALCPTSSWSLSRREPAGTRGEMVRMMSEKR